LVTVESRGTGTVRPCFCE